jgi:putative pyruvate formate lyase activating enzyme
LISTENNADSSHAVGAAIESLRRELSCCRLCPRNCGVNRTAGERGYCGLDDKARCFREMLRPAEETILGLSHQLYFSGCNLHCEFCSVLEWNEQPRTVPEMDVDELAQAVERRRGRGASHVNLLGGEPVVSLPGILPLLQRIRTSTRVVLDSNMYYNECVDELLRGWIDVCVADLKCGNDACAKALLDAGAYCGVVKDNIRRANGHMDLIVRHVVLPGHVGCCTRPALKWLAEELPGVKVSLRMNYVPPVGPVAAPGGYVADREARAAVEWARDMGLHLIE